MANYALKPVSLSRLDEALTRVTAWRSLTSRSRFDPSNLPRWIEWNCQLRDGIKKSNRLQIKPRATIHGALPTCAR